MRSITFLPILQMQAALWDSLRLRNLVEAVLLTLPALYLCIAFLPLDLTPKIIVTLTIIVPLGGFGLIGISDDSMTRWLGSWWKWRDPAGLSYFEGGQKMNLKELIFWRRRPYRRQLAAYTVTACRRGFQSKNIIGGVVITKDNRFVKIMEVLPVNIYLKSAIDRQNIISSLHRICRSRRMNCR